MPPVYATTLVAKNGNPIYRVWSIHGKVNYHRSTGQISAVSRPHIEGAWLFVGKIRQSSVDISHKGQ